MTDLGRRDVLVGVGSALLMPPVVPMAAGSQLAAKVARIGYVSTNLASNPHIVEAFRMGLRDLGYVEGHNLVIEYRSAEGRLERFPALAADFIALKVDVIVAANTQAALAAKRATATIPIVFAGPPDPVSSGLVTSLARPGANATGLASLPTSELIGKSLELLTLAVPGRSRVAALWHRDYPERTQTDVLGAVDTAARALGLHLRSVEVRGGPESFDNAFSEMTKARVDSLILLTSVLFASERRRLVNLAARHRLPAMYPVRDFVDDGGLMSYGPLWADLYRRAAIYVDKILKGARPADLPVEQPTKFELVINLKTTKALGLTIPPSLLARADHVIE
jgi:putative tryptophan/tyrosine transport system substrate-binding protein